MRHIGRIENELHADLFRDYLFNRGIEAEVEASGSAGWSVWVHDEDRLEEASSLLASFLDNPDDQEYIAGADGAEEKRVQQARQQQDDERTAKRRKNISSWFGMVGGGRVTIALILLSVVTSLLIQFGRSLPMVELLAISKGFSLAEIQSGQLWRLVTPVLMHFGIIHLVFNMMWLNDLGGAIERLRGPRFYLIFMVAVASASNLGQFYMSGPSFGGMSGVVYGLLGYVWMQSRFNPWSGFVLHSFTVQMMLVWFVLCLSGVIGHIANTTHAVGLVSGVVWGYQDARRRVP